MLADKNVMFRILKLIVETKHGIFLRLSIYEDALYIITMYTCTVYKYVDKECVNIHVSVPRLSTLHAEGM